MIDKWNEKGNPCPACGSDRPHLTGSETCWMRQYDRLRGRVEELTRQRDAAVRAGAAMAEAHESERRRRKRIEGRLARVLRLAQDDAEHSGVVPYIERFFGHGRVWSTRLSRASRQGGER